MSRFVDLVNNVEEEINNTTKSTLVKRWINQAQDEIEVFFPWPFLLKEEFIQTVAEHTTGTGTIKVTNGSASISGTGTA